jgi:hypothetical protein
LRSGESLFHRRQRMAFQAPPARFRNPPGGHILDGKRQKDGSAEPYA